jgi:hypothetical protein
VLLSWTSHHTTYLVDIPVADPILRRDYCH